MRTGDTPLTTADLLKKEMEERDLGVRGLSRLLANGGDEKAVEAWRRKLNHYLGGADPKDPAARSMEKSLGRPEGWFPRYQPTQRRARAAEQELADQRETLAELRTSVGTLRRTVVSLRRRVLALERQHLDGAADSSEEAPPN